MSDKNEYKNAISAAANIAVWGASIATGSVALVRAALLSGDATASTPVSEGGPDPLVTIAAIQPNSIEHAADLAEIAKILIENGAVLHLRDRRGLLPADYAMFSPSTAIAREITLATLRHFTQRYNNMPFRPNYRAMFCTLPTTDAVAAMRETLILNIAVVNTAIQRGLLRGDIALRAMPQAEIAFWDGLAIPPVHDLPRQHPGLVQAWEKLHDLHARRKNGGAVAPDILEAAEDHVRQTETQWCNAFKPGKLTP